MIERIFLDLDDVLNQLALYALKAVGCKISSLEEWKPEWGYNIVRVANELGIKITKEEFWSHVDWSNIPKSDEFDGIINWCKETVGLENVCLLTRIGIDRAVSEITGKLKWIERYIPEPLNNQFLIGPRKDFCGWSKSLLIDDNEENVNKFIKAGGWGLLVAKPWNSETEEIDFDSWNDLLWISRFKES